MADTLFESLKKSIEKKVKLDGEITIKVTRKELEILGKKASALMMSSEDLLREYLLKTPAFDGSVFEEKKEKKE